MRKRFIVGSAVAAASWYGYYRVTRWWKTWGVDPADAAMTLPGDDLVGTADMLDTRGIDIDAPPADVWPWLIQMGYDRAGWYSYDALDMKGRSADRILIDRQQLAVGDIVPTDPGGGFAVKVVEPERALVLYVDADVLAARTPSPTVLGETPGLAASGRFLETAVPPRFTATWQFYLQPRDGGRRTRLIERFGAKAESSSTPSRFLGPLLGFGLFVMVQKQLRGIRERAERLAAERRRLHEAIDSLAAVVDGPRAPVGAARSDPSPVGHEKTIDGEAAPTMS
jgi:hypothetical protein